MWTTDILREEHRWILLLVRALEHMLDASRERGRLDAQHAAEILALFKHFANGLHQEREERCLFPLLLTRARSVAERLDIARLAGDHEQERRAMQRMDQALLGAIYGEPRSFFDFEQEARGVVVLQREHIAHENRELLPLAERLLSAEDDAALVQAFGRLEGQGAQDPRLVCLRIEALCIGLGLAAQA